MCIVWQSSEQDRTTQGFPSKGQEQLIEYGNGTWVMWRKRKRVLAVILIFITFVQVWKYSAFLPFVVADLISALLLLLL